MTRPTKCTMAAQTAPSILFCRVTHKISEDLIRKKISDEFADEITQNCRRICIRNYAKWPTSFSEMAYQISCQNGRRLFVCQLRRFLVCQFGLPIWPTIFRMPISSANLADDFSSANFVCQSGIRSRLPILELVGQNHKKTLP